MNPKTTLSVLIVALALGAFYLVFETDTFNMGPSAAPEPQTPGVAKVGQPVIAGGLAVDKVKGIQLDTSDGSATLAKEGNKDDDWQQTQPVRFAMQGWQVRDILNDISDLRYSSTLTVGKNGMTLERLGLTPPRATVTITTDDNGTKKETVLSLGREAGAGRAYLVLGKPSESSTVYIVGDKLHDTLLKKKVRDLRSTSLTSVEPGAARHVTVSHDGKAIELVKSDDGRWALTAPVTGRADKDAVAELVRAISTVFIDGFVQDKPTDLAIFGLDKPSHVLSVEVAELADAKPEEKPADAAKEGDAKKEEKKPEPKITSYKLAIGAPADLSREKYYAMWQDAPVVFTLRKGDVEKLDKKIDDLRDARLTPVTRSDVRDVLLDHADAGKVHLLQDEGAWKFGDPAPDYALDPGVMDDLLKAIFDTRAIGYLTLDTVKLKAPIAEVTLGLLAQPDPEKLRVHEHDDGKLLVVRGNESTGYIVDRDHLALALKPAIAFRNRNVLDIAEPSIASIHVVRSGEFPADYTVTRAKAQPEGPPLPGTPADQKPKAKAGEWQLEGLDGAAVQNLITRLAPLRAVEWLPDAPDVASPDAVTIELTLADGTKRTITLHPASSTARVNDVKTAFKPEDVLLSAAAAELKNPVVLPYDNDQIRQVTLDVYTVKKDDGKFSMDKPGLNEAKAGQMFDTLAGLMVGHFVDPARAIGDPTSTLDVTTQDGKTHTLKLWLPSGAGEGDAVGQLADKTFTLPRDKADLLAKPPLQPAAAKKK